MPEGTYTEEDILKAENAVEDLDRLNQELAKTAEGYGVDTNEVVENASAVDPVASVRVGDSAVGELAEQYGVNLDETDDNTVAEDTVEEVVEEAEKVNNSDLAVGDIVTLSPELADNVPNYDPSDEFRIIEIDNGLVSLSRNGVADENLAYTAIEDLSKYNYVDPRIVSFQEQEIDEINETEENNVVTEYEDVYSDSSMIPDGQVETENVVEETVENETIENNVEEVAEPTEEKEEKPIIEKGSKPIRWAKHFLDKIRKNTSVEGISEKLQESIDKDKAGKTLSFKTVLYGKELKLAKAASSKWTQIKGWFKKDKEEVIEDEPVATEENDNIEETVINNESVVDTDVRREIKDNEISKVAGNEDPYKVFSKLTPEKQSDVFNNIINLLNDMQKDLIFKDELLNKANETIIASNEMLNKANEAIKASEAAMEKAAEVAKKQNDTIEELTKNNNMVNENNQEVVTNNVVSGSDNKEITDDSVQTNDSNELSTDAERVQRIAEYVQDGYSLNQAIGRDQADYVYEQVDANRNEWESTREDLIAENRSKAEAARAKKEAKEALEKEAAIDAYRAEGLSYSEALARWNSEQQQKEEARANQMLATQQDEFIDTVRKYTDYSIDGAINEWNQRQEDESRKIR